MRMNREYCVFVVTKTKIMPLPPKQSITVDYFFPALYSSFLSLIIWTTFDSDSESDFFRVNSFRVATWSNLWSVAVDLYPWATWPRTDERALFDHKLLSTFYLLLSYFSLGIGNVALCLLSISSGITKPNQVQVSHLRKVSTPRRRKPLWSHFSRRWVPPKRRHKTRAHEH